MKNQKSTAAIIVIGDEILSGRVKDENSPFLIKQLTKQGVNVQTCITIPDNITAIANTIYDCHKKYKWVFTAGGIGPTHDDITMEGIATTFNANLIQNEELVQLIKELYGKKFREEHLKMAIVPKGIKLLYSKKNRFPVLTFENIIIMPGVPEFLKAIYISIKSLYQGEKIHSKMIKITLEEAEIATLLKDTIQKFPGLKIGSYPLFRKSAFSVKLILQHKNKEILTSGEMYLNEKLEDYINEE